MDKEIWKNVPNYEGLYQVSNYGRVKSLKRKIIMKPTKYNGYCGIFLSKNGISKRYKVHRLVAEMFVSKFDYKSVYSENRSLIDIDNLEVNHKDENKSNNKADNLEWCTHLYNMKYGDWKNRRKEKIDISYCCKKVNQYDLNGNFIMTWNSIASVKRKFRINHISDCCNGKRKTAGGYIWQYA